jgi:predicted RecA/RadA family phage recombinase
MALEAQYFLPSGEVQQNAPAALVAGQVLKTLDGRAAVYTAVAGAANGERVCLAVEGQFLFASASATEFAAGDLVYWDASEDLAVTAAGATATGDFLLGPAVAAKANGATTVLVELNGVGASRNAVIVSPTAWDATAALAKNDHVTVVCNSAGAVAGTIPGAGPVNAGKMLTLVKTSGGAGAITVTPASGTIGGAASNNSTDANGDCLTVVSNGVSDWVIVPGMTAIA